MPPDQKSPYFQEWYEENRDDLNVRRRERYANDKAYRDKVQKWNKDARHRRRKSAEREERKAKRAVKLQTSGQWKTVEVEVDGVKVRMFTIGALAKAIGKGISTIRVWERNGVLPETPHRSNKGDRLYTLEMVESIQSALKKAGKLDIGVLKEKKRPVYVEREVWFPGEPKPKRMRLYKVGALAKAVNRTVAALTQMEKRKVLPKTPLVSSSLEYRLYSIDMIEIVQKAFDVRGGTVRGRSEWEDFHDEIVDGWTKLGVMDARLES